MGNQPTTSVEQKNPEQPVKPAAPQSAPSPVQNVAQPVAAQPSGRPGCGYTLLIVFITVICTLIIEAILLFAAAMYVGNTVKDTFSAWTNPATDSTESSGTVTADQEEMLASIGLTIEDLPPEIPIESVTCAINALGESRVKEIVSGEVEPGVSDLFKLRSCL